ncbi:unnamed protein product [Mesocestoides corti]|uniref:Uncharacterized protein n=1 Tax=Mesocestoides corti TaxID=53468 RepID=A0A0R3U403_MESCO|nr:unnamed protein product [Mesocestoides corti]
MAEILFTNGRSKNEMFEDSEPTIKTEYFDGKVEELPADSSDIFFGAEVGDFAPGSDPYGDLFLMDPNDLLGVREEVVGSDPTKASEEILVPEKSTNTETPSGLLRRSTRRKKLRQKQFRKVCRKREDRDSSDLEDFSIPLTVNPQSQFKSESSASVQRRVQYPIHSSTSVANGVRPRIFKINQALPMCNSSGNHQSGVVTTRRILAFKRRAEYGRQLLPRGKCFVDVSKRLVKLQFSPKFIINRITSQHWPKQSSLLLASCCQCLTSVLVLDKGLTKSAVVVA